jgi:hypothetical protein
VEFAYRLDGKDNLFFYLYFQSINKMNRLQQTRRQKIGYVYNAQVNNDVSTVNYARSPYAFMESQFDRNTRLGPSGAGFVDTIRSIYDKGKTAGRFLYDHRGKIVDAYTGEVGTALRNMIPDSDENARPGFPGEKHALLKLPNGKTGVGNYIGPGTNLMARLKRGDPPRTEVDKVAKAHDIRYALATKQSDIRRADNIMINKVKQIGRVRGDAPRNIAQANLMRAKVLGEDLGVLRKDAFSGDLSKNLKMSKEDKRLLMNELNKLAPQGYGDVQTQMLPGDALKMKLLQQMTRKRTKRQAGAGESRSRDLGKHYKLLGNGLILPGAGKTNILKFVVGKVVPSLMKTVGIPKGVVGIAKIAKMVSQALDMSKSGKLAQVVSHLTKTLLPILTAAKMKHMKMRGRGVAEMLSGKKNSLLENLGKGMLKAFKWYLNRGAKSRGLKPIFKGSGIHLPGGSFANFWKGFKKGFKMVFKPGAKILGTVATAMGQPEIGIPLTAVSGLL